MISLIFSLLIAQDRPVIRLEDSLIKGDIKRPGLVEVSGSQLQQRVEEAALKSLMRLERSILEPTKPIPKTNTESKN